MIWNAAFVHYFMLFVQIHDGCAYVGCNFGNMYGKHCNYPMIYTFQAY